MMQQYRKAKARNRDAVLFFRLGDFYEMFFEDAIEVSSLLNLTLTKRQGEPMCGIPWHSARSYIARLLKAGKKVAICEQIGEVGAGRGPGKGIVERDVVEVITPGTAMEEDFLDRASNNWLFALCAAPVPGGGNRLGSAWLDLGTAEFRCAPVGTEGGAAALGVASAEAAEDEVEAWLSRELLRLDPREVLIQHSLLERPEVARVLASRPGLILNRLPDWSFDVKTAASELRERFGLATLKGLGFGEEGPELAAARALLRYADDMSQTSSAQIRGLLPWEAGNYARIDDSTLRNLELVRNLEDSTRSFSLLETMDFTRTSPGARLIRQWIMEPLRRKAAIEARLEAVEFLYRRQRLLGELRGRLSRVLDTERLASRVAMKKAHAKDLLALRDSLAASLEALALMDREGGSATMAAAGAAPPAPPDAAAISEAIRDISDTVLDEPSVLLTEGRLIKPGIDAGLDHLHSLQDNARSLLETYLEEEKSASGIANLRVRYNRIIGYYLEVSKGKLEAVPAHFVRRQSLVTGERYSTARLAELESEINGATERIVEIERRLFLELRDRVEAAVPPVLGLARALAVHDCLASFAWAATERAWVRPRLFEDGRLRIADGRHPVVEAHLPPGTFVPNGIILSAAGVHAALDGLPAAGSATVAGPAGPAGPVDPAGPVGPGDGAPSFALITGPNMAGKSTFLRQTALIVLMAQAGSFVPASEAEIGIADRIFCRVGAHDDLARGESTFLVEMHETARILNTATVSSLVIMDEVGRGTSTLDGLAIARAVMERLLDPIGARTLFATHYHELTAIGHPRLRNFRLAVLEEEGDVVFLKRIEEGAALGSYGLHVARLAGIPPEVLARAASLRHELESREAGMRSGSEVKSGAEGGLPLRQGAPHPLPARLPATLDLFDPGELVLAELASIDIDRLTPLEALNRLSKLKKSLRKN
jgi:DNA mismatch repair protein MutS